MDVIGTRGYLDMGMGKNATVEDAVNHRRRRRRISLLNLVEDEITKWREEASVEEDIGMWKTSHENFKSKFSTKSTWKFLRPQGTNCT